MTAAMSILLSFEQYAFTNFIKKNIQLIHGIPCHPDGLFSIGYPHLEGIWMLRRDNNKTKHGHTPWNIIIHFLEKTHEK
ncbi:MAG: hypothetical protein H6Q14_1853 [Bacteroidetes bacterium]|nr:hypothetical protein [Bacteroidota bacterium]